MVNLTTQQLQPSQLFNPETGLATKEFIQQMNLVGLVMKRYIKCYPKNHA